MRWESLSIQVVMQQGSLGIRFVRLVFTLQCLSGARRIFVSIPGSGRRGAAWAAVGSVLAEG